MRFRYRTNIQWCYSTLVEQKPSLYDPNIDEHGPLPLQVCKHIHNTPKYCLNTLPKHSTQPSSAEAPFPCLTYDVLPPVKALA